jgi:hypothetical protein
MQSRHAEVVSKLHVDAHDLAGPESERYEFMFGDEVAVHSPDLQRGSDIKRDSYQ